MTGVEIAMIAGAAVSAMGAIQQGNAAKGAANFNAQVAQNNAIAARQNAASSARRQEREARIRAGANRASASASGLQLMGSTLDFMEDNAMEEELDRLTIIHQGELQASGLETSAQLMRAEGRSRQRAGYMGAAGTLLKGGATAYGSGAFGSTGSTVPTYTTQDALAAGYGQGI
jgi:hypothetical protein